MAYSIVAYSITVTFHCRLCAVVLVRLNVNITLCATRNKLAVQAMSGAIVPQG